MKKIRMILLQAIVLLIPAGCMFKAGNSSDADKVEVVDAGEFKVRLDADSTAVLLDVRRPEEYADGHLHGAMLLNWLDGETFRKAVGNMDRQRVVYIYCRSGRRSNEAAVYMSGKGYKVVDMKGGIIEWKKAGYPTE